VIESTGIELVGSQPLPGARQRPAGAPNALSMRERATLRWATRLIWAGRASLVMFAAVALISANREAGLLTLGALARISSPVRGDFQVGAAFLLLPAGAALWLAGEVLLWRGAGRRLTWQFGPRVVTIPLAALIALTFMHLSLALGWADIAFVLAGLGLLVLAYLFIFRDGPSGAALAGFVAAVGVLQSLVGLGQFVWQHDLGLGWLGELPLNPAVSGVSVLTHAGRILRAYGLMRHPNALGAILPLSLLAAISLWVRGARRERYFWLAALVVISAGLVVSFSRSGWLAALVGAWVWWVASRGRPDQLNRSPRPSLWRMNGLEWASALFTPALVVLAAIALQPDLMLGRVLGALGSGPLLEQSALAARLYSQQVAWDVIRRWPLWGVGTRQYVVAAAQLMHAKPAESLLVDSTPLVLWAELGLAGPVAWLGMGAALIGLGCRRRAGDPDLALATAWVGAVQVVCLFQAFFWPSQELWQGGIWLGLALGLWARAWLNSAERSTDVEPVAPPGSLDCRPLPLDSNPLPVTNVPGVRTRGRG
jgi:hypothetical protein